MFWVSNKHFFKICLHITRKNFPRTRGAVKGRGLIGHHCVWCTDSPCCLQTLRMELSQIWVHIFWHLTDYWHPTITFPTPVFSWEWSSWTSLFPCHEVLVVFFSDTQQPTFRFSQRHVQGLRSCLYLIRVGRSQGRLSWWYYMNDFPKLISRAFVCVQT